MTSSQTFKIAMNLSYINFKKQKYEEAKKYLNLAE